MIIASLAMLVAGLFRLVKAQRWLALSLSVIFIVGYALLIVGIFHVSDKHIGLWMLFEAMAFFPVWIMSGVVVYGIATRPPNQWYGQYKSPPSSRVRYLGLATLIIGATAWCLGAFVPDLTSEPRSFLSFAILAIAMLATTLVAIGLLWVAI
jgi:hypothetical protein